MSRATSAFAVLGVIVAFLLCAAQADAQATRTWVSGVGDDANPCSRTAPCKTFAGAISKTAINGEIDALDPGGFGAITITKSITLDGTYGAGFGSILASGTPGVTINVPVSTSDPLRTVRLRNLSITGAGQTGTIGVRIINASNVFVENSLIQDFGQRGISDERTSGGNLFVTDTIVRTNVTGGIAVEPASGSTAINATLDNVRLEQNGAAGLIAVGAKVTARNIMSAGSVIGFYTDQIGGSTQTDLENCAAFNNGTGVETGPGGATVRLSNCAIFGNTTGLLVKSGSMLSFGNNKIGGNGAGNTGATAAVPGQQ